jgi:hypothetical protein
LADRQTGVILQEVIATEPPAHFELPHGEAVLWRERRTPPFMEAAIAAAVVLAGSGLALASIVLTPLLLAAAVAALLAGRRLAAGHYLEDQLLTDRRALVVPRVGTAYGLALDDLENVELRGTKAIFTGHGHEMRFAFVRHHRALRKALESGAPHISLEQRWDPNCAG